MVLLLLQKCANITVRNTSNFRSIANVIVSKMPLKFAANLSMLFPDISLMSCRYKAAKDAGFKYVECGFPYLEPLETISRAKKDAGVEQVLINAWPGDLSKGDLGIAALPSRKAEFVEKLELSIEYAKALDCKRMHIMAGLKPKDMGDTEMEDTYLENIRFAADRLQKEGILALIEPINPVSIPNYFLGSLSKGVEYVRRINHPNLKLQFDVFHIQIIAGSLTFNLKECLPLIGHIQVAQVPDRGEPDCQGEINYDYVFKLIQDLGYDGYIGLEYRPRGDTVAGLHWMKDLAV